MNKALSAFLALSLLYVTSCKKDSTATCTPTDTTQTYTAKVKPILDASCVASGCHDAFSGHSNLTTYDGAVAATTSSNLITQIQTGIMPKLLPPLPDSSINKIIGWRDNCYQH